MILGDYFIYLLKKHILRAYYISITVLSAGDIAVNMRDIFFALAKLR